MPIFQQHPELLLAFRTGDPTALERVYRLYVPRVEAMVRRGISVDGRWHTLKRQDWRDLVQECFMRAFSQSARMSYDGLREYGPYLATLIHPLK